MVQKLINFILKINFKQQIYNIILNLLYVAMYKKIKIWLKLILYSEENHIKLSNALNIYLQLYRVK